VPAFVCADGTTSLLDLLEFDATGDDHPHSIREKCRAVRGVVAACARIANSEPPEAISPRTVNAARVRNAGAITTG
jgi:hypothetical protein